MTEHPSPTGGDPRALDQLHEQAALLLRQARAGDTVVLARLRELLPRLESLTDAAAAGSVELADVQHAVARTLGHDSWASLTRFFGTIDPVHAEAARFLKALREEDVQEAERVLARTPAVATYSIHTAAAVGDADVVAAFLAKDPALAVAPSPGDGLRPLIYAVHEELKRARGVPPDRHAEVVRALLDAGADPNTSAPLPGVSDTIPALYFPSVRGNVALAQLLLERGAAATDGESLYHAAQHAQLDILALLERFGADLSRGPAAHGNTPLHFLAAHAPVNPITPKAMQGLRWLLAHGADPRVTSTGPHVSASQRGETPLHRAAELGHDVGVLAALLDAGAPIEAARDDGRTAYQLAVRIGNAVGAAFLAARGADPALGPADQLLAACASGRADEARRLAAAYPGLVASLGPAAHDILAHAVGHDDYARVSLLAELGWPLAHEGEWGGTPLHWAAWNGRTAMVRHLLMAGAPVNVRDSRYGSSPIAWACHGSRHCDRGNDTDYPEIVGLLLDAGATRPESYNHWHESPESLARPSVVAVLRARGFAV